MLQYFRLYQIVMSPKGDLECRVFYMFGVTLFGVKRKPIFYRRLAPSNIFLGTLSNFRGQNW